MRARILGSLWRTGEREITYLRILREGASQELETRARHGLRRIAQDEVPGLARLEVIKSDEPAAEIARRADASDLAIMGLQRFSRRRKSFGEMTRRIVQNTNCPVIMISRGD